MVKDSVQIGQIVSSGAGRDKERFFVIIKILNDSAVEVVDGKLRKIDRPKKKNQKHLIFYSVILSDIAEKLSNGERITNAMVRKALANSEVVKRANCSGEGGDN